MKFVEGMDYDEDEVEWIKSSAKELSILSGSSYCFCLEHFVKDLGFSSYAHYLACFKAANE